MVRILIVLAILFALPLAHGSELEIFAGANSTTYDDAPDANTWGVSLRAQYNFTSNGDTWMVNINAPGGSLFASTFSAGYLLRSTGNLFWESGLAGGYNRIFGPQVEVILGMGYRVTPDFFIDFPVVLGSSTGVLFSPYLGFQF